MRGLSAHPGKMMVGKPAQGFESLTLCHIDHAGVAQLVERHLAKVNVVSSSLISRSK